MSSVLVPSTAPLLVKLTVPVGATGPEYRTTEISVTCWPPVGEVDDAVRVSVVGRSWTDCDSAGATPARFSEAPLYAAEMACSPIALKDDVNVAAPAAFSVTVPSTFDPSLKTTVPEGSLLLPFDIVAVKVTGSSTSEGFWLGASGESGGWRHLRRDTG